MVAADVVAVVGGLVVGVVVLYHFAWKMVKKLMTMMM
jgi:hypothetical protein